MEVCLRRISWDSVGAGLRWISLDPVFVCLRSCGSRFDLSDLQLSSTAMVPALVCWSFGALVRQLPDCLLQQGLPGSGDGGVMTVARLRLAPVLVVVARWFTDLDVILNSDVLYTTLTVGE